MIPRRRWFLAVTLAVAKYAKAEQAHPQQGEGGRLRGSHQLDRVGERLTARRSS